MSAMAQQTSSNIQTVTTATDETASTIHETGTRITRFANIAGKAVNDAIQTSDVVRSLPEAAQMIDEVVGLITDIASQTNLRRHRSGSCRSGRQRLRLGRQRGEEPCRPDGQGDGRVASLSGPGVGDQAPAASTT